MVALEECCAISGSAATLVHEAEHRDSLFFAAQLNCVPALYYVHSRAEARRELDRIRLA